MALALRFEDTENHVRVWHLTRTLLGGAGQYALRLSNALNKLGIESNVLLAEGPWTQGTVPIKRVDSGARRFAARAFRSVFRRICTSPFHSIRGLELFDAPEPILEGDIVHLQGLSDWIGFAGLRRMIPPGARVFQTVHGPWEFSGGCVILAGSHCDRFRQKCLQCPALRSPWRNVAAWELNNKKAFVDYFHIQPIANSRWIAARVRESALYRNITYLPLVPPIVHECFFSHSTTNLRDKLRIPADRMVLCLGARALTDSFKGIREFLIHLGASVDLVKRVTVLAFGDGSVPCPANIDVRFLGVIQNPADLAAIFRTADLFVSPSRMESFGMALVEAQATGTPVVGFQVGGIQDAVWPNHYANLVPIDRWDLLLGRISTMLSQKDQRDHIVKTMSEWVAASFSAAAVAQRQLEVYAPKDVAKVLQSSSARVG